MRKTIAVLSGLMLILAVNWSIFERERILKNGQLVILELAPIDPRSLMQGDYMALRFKIADEIFGRGESKPEMTDGQMIVKLDDQRVGQYPRIATGGPLGTQEVSLRYRVRNGQAKFATNGFFFEEGRADEYAKARYGEFRVSSSGEMLLTHLLGENRERLGTSSRSDLKKASSAK